MLAGSVCRHAQEMVAAQFEMTTERLLERNRSRAVVVPRQLAIYLARRMSKACLSVPLSYPTIASRFGYDDHTTAIHAVHATEERALQDERFALMLMKLTAQADALVDQMRAFKIKDLPPRIPASVVCDLACYGRATLTARVKAGVMPAPIDTAKEHIFETEAVLVALGLAPKGDVEPQQPIW